MKESCEEVLADLDEALKPARQAVRDLESAETVETDDDLRANLDEAIGQLTEALKTAKALRKRAA